MSPDQKGGYAAGECEGYGLCGEGVVSVAFFAGEGLFPDCWDGVWGRADFACGFCAFLDGSVGLSG